MQPEIITKSFLLAGFKAAIDISEKHWQGMDDVVAALKTSLDSIGGKLQPVRFIGMWEADPAVDYSKKKNHSKLMYFYGVEVSGLDGVPTGCVTKSFPKSAFAVFKEHEHNPTANYEQLAANGYVPDKDFQGKYAFDMEIFGVIEKDETALEWDFVIPIKT
ncbi:MAG: GyrI-like domain-containing protein [Oscillospiraceae bacterium]|nr:GyrI-like domain-containing protein [Oscillospiraceae bacterium]